MVEKNDNFIKLVSMIDKLRDIGLNDHISMPRIAVLGSQSSGKSSLLEAIVGMNFLPRGSGVVTRRPLELRMVRKKTEKTYGVFKNEPKQYTDFNEIRLRIQEMTNEVCGTNKGIVDKPIILSVYGPNCSDLTVIDLPGITRIPIGNQAKNIE
jgi:dynamin 1-like protein